MAPSLLILTQNTSRFCCFSARVFDSCFCYLFIVCQVSSLIKTHDANSLVPLHLLYIATNTAALNFMKTLRLRIILATLF